MKLSFTKFDCFCANLKHAAASSADAVITLLYAVVLWGSSMGDPFLRTSQSSSGPLDDGPAGPADAVGYAVGYCARSTHDKSSAIIPAAAGWEGHLEEEASDSRAPGPFSGRAPRHRRRIYVVDYEYKLLLLLLFSFSFIYFKNRYNFVDL